MLLGTSFSETVTMSDYDGTNLYNVTFLLEDNHTIYMAPYDNSSVIRMANGDMIGLYIYQQNYTKSLNEKILEAICPNVPITTITIDGFPGAYCIQYLIGTPVYYISYSMPESTISIIAGIPFYYLTDFLRSIHIEGSVTNLL
jgi:hypothetical protein